MTRGAASEGLINILYLLIFVSFLGIAVTGITRGFAEPRGATVNETVLGNLDANNGTSTTLNDMKSKFIDDHGNARTGITDIINTLFTGIGGIITVLFQTPSTLANVFSQIVTSMGLVSDPATANLAGLGIEFLLVVIIIGTVYMISRR